VADEIRFDWDEANLEHIARHNVKSEEAEQVLTNEPTDAGFEVVGGENRWASVGHTNKLRILKVFWTVRHEDKVRVITAFDAPREYLREKVGL